MQVCLQLWWVKVLQWREAWKLPYIRISWKKSSGFIHFEAEKSFILSFYVGFQKNLFWFCKQTLVESNMKKHLFKSFLVFFFYVLLCLFMLDFGLTGPLVSGKVAIFPENSFLIIMIALVH